MTNPYRHPISTPVPELQGIATIATQTVSADDGCTCARRHDPDQFDHQEDCALVAVSADKDAGEVERLREAAALECERVGRIFGEKPPGGEHGTNIAWDTAQRCAAAVRALVAGEKA